MYLLHSITNGICRVNVYTAVIIIMHNFSMLGATALRVAAVFGPGTGRVWINRPQCTLNSTSLDNCTFGTPLGGTIGCGHNNDAGVICFSEFGM